MARDKNQNRHRHLDVTTHLPLPVKAGPNTRQSRIVPSPLVTFLAQKSSSSSSITTLHTHSLIKGNNDSNSCLDGEQGKKTRRRRRRIRDRVYARLRKAVKIRRIAAQGRLAEYFNYERCSEAKVPTQTEEVLSGEQEAGEVRLMSKGRGSLPLCCLPRPG